jgi:hypothetical protein
LRPCYLFRTLAFLAFVIAVIALVQARNYKARVDDLERRVAEHYDQPAPAEHAA